MSLKVILFVVVVVVVGIGGGGGRAQNQTHRQNQRHKNQVHFGNSHELSSLQSSTRANNLRLALSLSLDDSSPYQRRANQRLLLEEGGDCAFFWLRTNYELVEWRLFAKK
jgi:hypothetical protein